MFIGGLKAAALTVGKDVECARSRYKKYLIGRFLYLYFKTRKEAQHEDTAFGSFYLQTPA